MSGRSSKSNESNNEAAGKSRYSLRPRKKINYKELAEDADDDDDSASRGHRRPRAPTSGRGSRARGKGRKRSNSGVHSSRSRSNTQIAQVQAEDQDMDEDFKEYQQPQMCDAPIGIFTAADKDFFPINLTEEEILDTLINGNPFENPTLGACSFDNIGGLNEIIDEVWKTISMPLLHHKFFVDFSIRPKKGLIFHGPPGVGKTMTARALIKECEEKSNQRISFFVRKGTDLLDPYVGKSEGNLSKLFDAAKKLSPSIIFLDEFDALARCRTLSASTHTETNVVSTLLALMDGLDDRGMVFVIGATNRLDAIDPAFRRPGRFDSEIRFTMPELEARKDILMKKTTKWRGIKASMVDYVAESTDGFSGADLSLVCETAALNAFVNAFPDEAACSGDGSPELDYSRIRVTMEDFEYALDNVQSSRARLQGS